VVFHTDIGLTLCNLIFVAVSVFRVLMLLVRWQKGHLTC